MSSYSIAMNYFGTQSKKKEIEKFGGFILKGGRGSPQKPNFCIPLIWDILVRREGSKPEFPNLYANFIDKISLIMVSIF